MHRSSPTDLLSTATALHGDPDVHKAGASTTMKITAAKTSRRLTAPSTRKTLPLLPAGFLSRKITRILRTITASHTTTIRTTPTLMARLRLRTLYRTLARHQLAQYATVLRAPVGGQVPPLPHHLHEHPECPSKPQDPQAPTAVPTAVPQAMPRTHPRVKAKTSNNNNNSRLSRCERSSSGP